MNMKSIMSITLISARDVALPPTLGVVHQERGLWRLCFWWFHLVVRVGEAAR